MELHQLMTDVTTQRAELSGVVMAITPDGMPHSIKQVQVEAHDDGTQTIWLHIEEI